MNELINKQAVMDILKGRKALYETDYDTLKGDVDSRLQIGYILQELDELIELVDWLEITVEKNCGDCSRRKFYQEGYRDGLREKEKN